MAVASAGLCKFAPRSRQITTPAPHDSVFTGRMPFLPPNQQHQNTAGKLLTLNKCDNLLLSVQLLISIVLVTTTTFNYDTTRDAILTWLESRRVSLIHRTENYIRKRQNNHKMKSQSVLSLLRRLSLRRCPHLLLSAGACMQRGVRSYRSISAADASAK